MVKKIFLFFTFLFPLFAQASEFNYEELVALITKNQIKTIEDLLKLKNLPLELRSNIVAIYSSRSTQGASFEHPRILSFSKGAKFVMAFNGDPKQKGHLNLEIIQFREHDKSFELREISFQAKGKGAPTFSPANPQRCLKCHGPDPRPNWEHYFRWPGVYGSTDGLVLGRQFQGKSFKTGATTETKEKSAWLEFLNNYKKNQRYAQLTLDKTLTPLNSSVFTSKIFGANYQRIVHKMTRHPFYSILKYSLISQILCRDEKNSTDYFPFLTAPMDFAATLGATHLFNATGFNREKAVGGSFEGDTLGTEFTRDEGGGLKEIATILGQYDHDFKDLFPAVPYWQRFNLDFSRRDLMAFPYREPRFGESADSFPQSQKIQSRYLNYLTPEEAEIEEKYIEKKYDLGKNAVFSDQEKTEINEIRTTAKARLKKNCEIMAKKSTEYLELYFKDLSQCEIFSFFNQPVPAEKLKWCKENNLAVENPSKKLLEKIKPIENEDCLNCADEKKAQADFFEKMLRFFGYLPSASQNRAAPIPQMCLECHRNEKNEFIFLSDLGEFTSALDEKSFKENLKKEGGQWAKHLHSILTQDKMPPVNRHLNAEEKEAFLKYLEQLLQD